MAEHLHRISCNPPWMTFSFGPILGCIQNGSMGRYFPSYPKWVPLYFGVIFNILHCCESQKRYGWKIFGRLQENDLLVSSGALETTTVILVYVITLTISSEVSAYAKTDSQPSLQRCVSLDSYVDEKIQTHRTSNSACLRRMSEG